MQAIAEETISWEHDSTFGYEVATAVPGIDDERLLQPRLIYEHTGRRDEYARIVQQLKRERLAHLKKYPALTEEIVQAAG